LDQFESSSVLHTSSDYCNTLQPIQDLSLLQ